VNPRKGKLRYGIVREVKEMNDKERKGMSWNDMEYEMKESEVNSLKGKERQCKACKYKAWYTNIRKGKARHGKKRKVNKR